MELFLWFGKDAVDTSPSPPLPLFLHPAPPEATADNSGRLPRCLGGPAAASLHRRGGAGCAISKWKHFTFQEERWASNALTNTQILFSETFTFGRETLFESAFFPLCRHSLCCVLISHTQRAAWVTTCTCPKLPPYVFHPPTPPRAQPQLSPRIQDFFSFPPHFAKRKSTCKCFTRDLLCRLVVAPLRRRTHSHAHTHAASPLPSPLTPRRYNDRALAATLQSGMNFSELEELDPAGLALFTTLLCSQNTS
jgi:hypothetical protein